MFTFSLNETVDLELPLCMRSGIAREVRQADIVVKEQFARYYHPYREVGKPGIYV